MCYFSLEMAVGGRSVEFIRGWMKFIFMKIDFILYNTLFLSAKEVSEVLILAKG